MPVESKEVDVNILLDFEKREIREDQNLVFGWASIVETKEGEEVVDAEGHVIDELELEQAAYVFVKHGGFGSVMHQYYYAAAVVESMVFTKEKMAALGIPEGTLPVGWWIGMYIYDDEVFELVKNGTFKMFSIAGKAILEEVAEED